MPRLHVRVRRDVHDLALVHRLHEEQHHEVHARRVPIAHEVLLALEQAIHILELRIELLVDIAQVDHSAHGRDEGPYEEGRQSLQVVEHHRRHRRHVEARLGEPHELLLAHGIVLLVATGDLESARAVVGGDEVGCDGRPLDDDAP